MKPSEVLFPSTRGRFGMFDSVELIHASDVPQFGSRAMFDDLQARVDNTLDLVRRPSSVEKNEPWVILANARAHLADQMCREGADVESLVNAHMNLGEIQECLVLNRVRICRNCEQMEGLHWAFGYCRIQPSHGDQRLSLRFEAE
jgi:hypothetical protein